MSNVLILGANGQVARHAIELFLKETDARLTLYLRNSRRLRNPGPDRARVIEGDYTILRPAWFTDVDEIDYETTQKGEPFKGSVVSRKSVAALVVKLAESSKLGVRRSLGVSKPE